MKIYLAFFAVLCVSSVLLEESQAAEPECRTAALPDGTPAIFCKDNKGNWKQQEGAVAMASTTAAAGPVSQRGQATYRGTFSAAVSKKQRRARNQGLGDLLGQAINGDVNATRYEGALTLVMKFDGAAVTADISGTGGINPGKLTGLVRNGSCRLTSADSLMVYEGPCTRTSFSGTIRSNPSNRDNVSGQFDARSSDYVDQSEKDNLRAELKAKCDAGSTTACVEMDQLK